MAKGGSQSHLQANAGDWPWWQAPPHETPRQQHAGSKSHSTSKGARRPQLVFV